MTPASYGEVSFWLADAGEDLTPRPSLPGPADVDVAILGAGYTGLWTAWALLEREPSLRVVVLEAEIAGFGASGRNGSWCVGALGVTPGELARRFGAATAQRTYREVAAAVDGVGEVCSAQGLDVGFRKGGVLRVARGAHERPRVEAAWRDRERLGLADGAALLSADELSERVRVEGARGALFDPHAATVHPGRLVRGLARLVERRGATIHERTRVTAFLPGEGRQRPRLRAVAGDVTADTVVLAGEAYLAGLAPLHRHLLPVYSLIVLTEPLGDAAWDGIGWAGRECLSSQRLSVDYLARTSDGRILLGGRGAPYRFGSKVRPGFDRHEATHAWLRSHLVAWFPALTGVRFTHAWGGPVAMPRAWLPTFSHNPRTGVAAAFGYTGQGVAAAHLAGRVLADAICGDGGRWAWLPMAGHRPRRWEPEPLRWLGVRAMQASVTRLDRRAERTGRPLTGRTLTERLLRH